MSVLITGGVKSGKSSYALHLAEAWKSPRFYLATAVALDEEMKLKITRHQQERGANYITIEEPVHIDRHVHDRLVLDCVTLWMNNIFFEDLETDWETILKRFLDRMHGDTILVTNETGLGNIPADAVSRRYNNALGRANRLIAEQADEVYMMVAGIPMRIK